MKWNKFIIENNQHKLNCDKGQIQNVAINWK